MHTALIHLEECITMPSGPPGFCCWPFPPHSLVMVATVMGGRKSMHTALAHLEDCITMPIGPPCCCCWPLPPLSLAMGDSPCSGDSNTTLELPGPPPKMHVLCLFGFCVGGAGGPAPWAKESDPCGGPWGGGAGSCWWLPLLGQAVLTGCWKTRRGGHPQHPATASKQFDGTLGLL